MFCVLLKLVLLFTTQVDWKSTFVGLDLHDLEVFRWAWFSLKKKHLIWLCLHLVGLFPVVHVEVSPGIYLHLLVLIEIQLCFHLMSVQLFLHIPYIWKWWFHISICADKSAITTAQYMHMFCRWSNCKLCMHACLHCYSIWLSQIRSMHTYILGGF